MKYFFVLVLTAGIALADQVTKQWIEQTIPRGYSQSVFGDIFRFTHIRNPHSAFGISFGKNFPYQWLTIGIMFFILILVYKEQRKYYLILYGFLLGGALGNLLDRFKYKAVVDFLDIGIGSFRWPIFNIADSFVTIGIILLIVFSFTEKTKKNQLPSTTNPSS